MERNHTVLLNPGPVVVDPRVRRALAQPDLCHREPEFSDLMTRIRGRVTRVCGGGAAYTTVLFTGSGTAALEATLSSIVPPDGKVLVLSNGHYGERIAGILSVHHIAHDTMDFGWATPINLKALGQRLSHDAAVTHVAMVHHETSTGMLNAAHEVGQIVADSGRSLVVDAISSLGGEILDVQADRIDWCVATANKCLEGVPGVSCVCAPRSELDRLADIPAHTYYLNLHKQYVAEDEAQAPPFTPAVQSYLALDVALDLLLEEGVEARNRRYASLAHRLRAGLEERGLRLLLPPEYRASTLTTVYLPEGLGYVALHDRLKALGFVIYAGQETLRNSVFRVANMGQITHDDIDRFLGSLGLVLSETNDRVDATSSPGAMPASATSFRRVRVEVPLSRPSDVPATAGRKDPGSHQGGGG